MIVQDREIRRLVEITREAMPVQESLLCYGAWALSRSTPYSVGNAALGRRSARTGAPQPENMAGPRCAYGFAATLQSTSSHT